MAKIYHVRLKPGEARPILRLARREKRSFQNAARVVIAAGARRIKIP